MSHKYLYPQAQASMINILSIHTNALNAKVIWCVWLSKKHMLAHSGVKNHNCSECGKSFGQSGKLKSHMITHTREKVHECSECGDSFCLADHLKRHKLTYSGEKPYKCPQCDYACSQAGTLRDHIKTHSLEKPNQCKWCNLSSIAKSSPTSAHPQWREVLSL